jgi:hypothetical protein
MERAHEVLDGSTTVTSRSSPRAATAVIIAAAVAPAGANRSGTACGPGLSRRRAATAE